MAQGIRVSASEVRIGDEEGGERPGAGTPFRILVMGDFGGRRPLERAWRPALVDRDNFADVMRRAGVEARLAWPEQPELVLPIAQLADLHPDALYDRLPALEQIRSLRAGVANPARHPDAAARARALLDRPTPADAMPAADRPASGSEWLADLLGETHSSKPQAQDPIAAFLQRLGRQYAVAPPPSDQAHLLALLDETAGAALREILHHPRFQALEAAWRALKLLTDRLETGTNLKVYVLDVTREELAADLAVEPGRSRLEKLLTEPEAEPWSLVAGLYRFGPTAEDAADLLSIARMARAARAPFLAAAADRVAGCDSLAMTPDPHDWRHEESDPGVQAWRALRTQPEAAWLGLALPRFLLRLPYGQKTDPCERFGFEEMPDLPRHEDYLWSYPAVACALLLGRSFSREGWDMGEALERELDGLPLHVYRDAGESQVKPCAELALRERALEPLLEAGLLVLVSPRGEDRAVVWRWQSLATPPARLAGPWNPDKG